MIISASEAAEQTKQADLSADREGRLRKSVNDERWHERVSELYNTKIERAASKGERIILVDMPHVVLSYKPSMIKLREPETLRQVALFESQLVEMMEEKGYTVEMLGISGLQISW